MRVWFVPLLIGVLLSPLGAQELDFEFQDPAVEIPEEYEAAVRDLVERYEELRQILRSELERNNLLYTQEELNAAVSEAHAEYRDLEAAYTRLAEEHKTMHEELKTELAAARGSKTDLRRTNEVLAGELGTLRLVLDDVEEQRIFEVAATVSPAGSLGALGTINVPGTGVGLMGGARYLLRDKEFDAVFGVSYGFLRHSTVLGAGRNRQASD